MPNLIPSQGRSALVQLLLNQAQVPRQSGSLVESANIAAQPIVAALLQRRQERAQREEQARQQQLIEQLLGVPQPGQTGLMNIQTGQIDNREIPRRLSAQQQRTSALAQILAQNPEGASQLANLLLGQQLTPERPVTLAEGAQLVSPSGRLIAENVQETDGPFEEFVDPNDPTNIRAVRRDSPEADRLADAGWIKAAERQEIRTGELAPQTRRELSEEILSINTSIGRMQSMAANFDPEFLTVPGRLRNMTLKARDLNIPVVSDILGGDLTAEERDFMTRFTTLRNTAIRELNELINRLSGAATSAQEAERLRSTMPDPDNNSPTEFIANFNTLVRDLQVVKARNMLALQQGIEFESGDDLEEFMTFDQVQQRVNERYNEEIESGTAQGLSADEARARAQLIVAREFGL